MSADIIVKLTTPEISVTTANTIYDSTIVRVFAAAQSVVTLRDSTTAILGSITMPANSIDYFKKQPTDTLEGTTALLCTRGNYA